MLLVSAARIRMCHYFLTPICRWFSVHAVVEALFRLNREGAVADEILLTRRQETSKARCCDYAKGEAPCDDPRSPRSPCVLTPDQPTFGSDEVRVRSR